MNTLKAMWWKIYPNDDEHRWMPLIWLPFMVWAFVAPLWAHYGPLGWVANAFGGIVFILLYLQAFSRPEPYKLLSILAMTAMVPVFIHVNEGNVALLIYAAAASGFHPSLRRVSLLIGLDVAILGFCVYHLQIPVTFWGSILLLIIIVGFGNHYWALKHCEGAKAAARPG